MIERPIYSAQLRQFAGKPIIKVLTGMRRSGKSSLLRLFSEETEKKKPVIFINMESLEFEFLVDYQALYHYVKKGAAVLQSKPLIVIDEIQEIREWEKAVLSLLTEDVGDIYISGSNSHLLSTELSTLLAGRYVEIQVYPLGFREFLDFRTQSAVSPIGDRNGEFRLFLRYGGLPGIHFLPMQDDAVFPYLSGIHSSVLLRDVVRRHQIRDVALLERVLSYLYANTGNITSAKNIADYFKSQRIKISVDSVLNYIHYLSQALIIHQIKRYDLKGRRVMELFDKYYPADTGLRHGIAGYREDSISGLLENLVCLELLRQGYRVTFGYMEGLEIDFIAEKQDERQYFQVAYLLDSEKTADREFGNLGKTGDHYPKTLLSMDQLRPGGRGGIRHLYLPDFLAEGNVTD